MASIAAIMASTAATMAPSSTMAIIASITTTLLATTFPSATAEEYAS